MHLQRSRKASASSRVAVTEPFPASTPQEQEYRELLRGVEQQALATAEMLVGRELAEDVFHDVAYHLYGKWNELPPEAHTAAYFLTSITNRALTYKRRERKYEELPETLDELEPLQVQPSEPGQEVHALDVIGPVLERVPEQRRYVWVMRLQGLSNHEIAEKLGIDVQVVRKYMRMATAEVSEGLEKGGVSLSFETLLSLLPARTSEASND